MNCEPEQLAFPEQLTQEELDAWFERFLLAERCSSHPAVWELPPKMGSADFIANHPTLEQIMGSYVYETPIEFMLGVEYDDAGPTGEDIEISEHFSHQKLTVDVVVLGPHCIGFIASGDTAGSETIACMEYEPDAEMNYVEISLDG